MFRPFIEQKQRAAERFGGWFAPSTDLDIFVRNQVTRLMAVGPIGRWLFGRMIADRFPLPRLRISTGRLSFALSRPSS